MTIVWDILNELIKRISSTLTKFKDMLIDSENEKWN